MNLLFSFEGLTFRSGDDDEMDTPVPVPNTEVKHLSGDNSYASHSEDSKLPGDLPSSFLLGFFVSNIFADY